MWDVIVMLASSSSMPSTERNRLLVEGVGGCVLSVKLGVRRASNSATMVVRIYDPEFIGHFLMASS